MTLITKIGSGLTIAAGIAGATSIFFGGLLLGGLAFVLAGDADALNAYPLGWYGALAVSLAIACAGLLALAKPQLGGFAVIVLGLIGVLLGGPVMKYRWDLLRGHRGCGGRQGRWRF